jgi:hypothetical protein
VAVTLAGRWRLSGPSASTPRRAVTGWVAVCRQLGETAPGVSATSDGTAEYYMPCHGLTRPNTAIDAMVRRGRVSVIT